MKKYFTLYIMNTYIAMSLLFLFSFGSYKIESIPISNPQSISVDPKGNIYLADTGNNRIIKYSQEGHFIKSIGGFGWDKEQFDTPMDICAKSVLDVFIADYNNHRIERYDKDLNYISSFYSDESQNENLQFGFPVGVSVSIHGELILIDSENYRLLKINSFGEPELSFGDFAEGRGKVDEPIQIELGRSDKIYVSDKTSNRIVVFDYFGNYLTEIGNGILNDPHGIYFDNSNRLWISDMENKEIYAFAETGELLLRWGQGDPAIDAFNNPKDIISFANRVYVLDNNLIHVFKILPITKIE